MQCLVAAALCLSLVNGQGFPVALSPGGPPPVNPSNSVMPHTNHGQNFALPPPTAPPQQQPQQQQPQQQHQQQQQQQQPPPQQQGYNPMMPNQPIQYKPMMPNQPTQYKPMMPNQPTQYKPMQQQPYNPHYMYNQPPQIPNAFQQYQTNPMPNNNLAWPRPPQNGYGMQNSGWGRQNSGWGAQNPSMMRGQGQGQSRQNNNMDQMSNLMLLGGNNDAFWDLQSMRMFGPMGLMMDIPQEMMWLGMGNRGQGGGMGMGQGSGSNNLATTFGLMHLLN